MDIYNIPYYKKFYANCKTVQFLRLSVDSISDLFFFRLKIIDQNDFPYAGESKSKTGKGVKNEPIEEDKEAENEALELMTTQEELPQVAGVVDDSRQAANLFKLA